MMVKVKERNITIDIMRLFFSICVVCIHINPFTGGLNYIASRIYTLAVPFFCVVAGYYFYERVINDKVYCYIYIKKLMITYIALSLLYFTTNLYLQVKFDGYLTIKFYTIFVERCLNGHLWYLVAISFDAFLLFIFVVLKKEKYLFATIIPIAIYSQLRTNYINIFTPWEKLQGKIQLSFNSLMGLSNRVILLSLPFFLMGAYFAYKKDFINKVTITQSKCILLTATIVYLIENIIIIMGHTSKYNGNYVSPLYFISCFFIWCLKNSKFFSTDSRHSYYCKHFSEIIYYIHPYVWFWISTMPILDVFKDISDNGTVFILVLITSMMFALLFIFILEGIERIRDVSRKCENKYGEDQ